MVNIAQFWKSQESTKGDSPQSRNPGLYVDRLFLKASSKNYEMVSELQGAPGRLLLTTPRKMLATTMSEAQAIEGAKQGDGECFELLYKLHKRRVYSLCLRMLGNVEAAEDFTQDAFLQLHRKIASFRGDSAFSTWLHRITVNVVLMQLRKRGLPVISLEEALEPVEEGGPQRDFGCKDQILAGSIDRLVLERAVESLPPGYRIIFVLHDVEGYEHNEIAEMLGCSVGNSKSQLHKARTKLRDLLRFTRAENARNQKVNIQRQVAVAKGRASKAAATAA